jgi:hypothetical protein
MTDSKTLDRLEALCAAGATFEQALAETGLAEYPLSLTAQIFKYWRQLEMEHAFEAAKQFYDRYLLLEDAP